MASKLSFAGKVVVVTGAGGGIGRAYALLFGSRGARVVVNDLGGDPRGQGSDKMAADVVANQIRKDGGIAVADYNSVLEGARIVETAMENFGRIDILVNNAGILRDRSFARTSDDDWDAVHSVHLKGSFITTRAAFPHMKKQNYGKIIMTASTSGIYGNFGQANYSAAKLGLLGLSNTVAIEGAKYNVSCNTIVPTGGTRMTEGILPPEFFKELKPELIAPMVVWLCHEDCEDNGGVFEAAAGWYGKYRWERTKGAVCRKSLTETVSPEAVRDSWEKISDFTDSDHLTSQTEAGGFLAEVLEDMKQNTSGVGASMTSDEANISKPAIGAQPTSGGVTGPLSAVGKTVTEQFKYGTREVILYALGVGVSTKDENGLKFLYEGHDTFAPLPTYVVIPAMASMMESQLFTSIQGWEVDLSKALHGEQYIEFVKTLPTSGTLTSTALVTDVLDKGSGAVVLCAVDTRDEWGDLVAKSQITTFIVGAGGFGGPRKSENIIPLINPPTRKPDAVRTFVTSVDQAALYRLSGDFNPLHIDPDFAAMGGFDTPILHGLGSFGVSTRAILDEFCGGDPSKFKAVKTRFSSPVIPGQTLTTSMWKEGDRIYFETHVKETGKTCLTGGYVDLVGEGESGNELSSPKLFSNMAAKVQDNPNMVKADLASSIVVWNILKNGVHREEWTTDFYSKPFVIHQGLPRVNIVPTATVTATDNIFSEMFSGKLRPQTALNDNKLKLHGSLNAVSSVVDLYSPQSRL